MASTPRKMKQFIIDVDGVLTDGTFWYSKNGKEYKRFGPDDNDALVLLQRHIEIVAVSGDKRGFPITKKRVADDMKLPLFSVSTFDRIRWMEHRYKLDEIIYMGDGIFDAPVFDVAGYGIAPANAFSYTKQKADFVTKAKGGEGAAAEAALHIAKKFFGINLLVGIRLKKGEGVWGK